MNVFKKYLSMDYKGRVMVKTRITLIISFIMGIYKLFLVGVGGTIFLANGLSDIVLAIAKALCLIAIFRKKPANSKTNILISILAIAVGIEYTICMGQIFFNHEAFKAPLYVAISVTIISSLESLLAIVGLFRVRMKGYYFRTIKLLDFSIALTAIALAIRAMLYQSENEYAIYFSVGVGLVFGFIIIILGITLFIATWRTIFDRLHHEYYSKIDLKVDHIHVKLRESYIFGDYTYEAYVIDNHLIDGNIIKHHPKMLRGSIYKQILLVLIWIIFFIPYIILAIYETYQVHKVAQKLDEYMTDLGYEIITVK